MIALITLDFASDLYGGWISWENPAAPFDSNEEAFGRAHTAERSPALAGEKERKRRGQREGGKKREREGS